MSKLDDVLDASEPTELDVAIVTGRRLVAPGESSARLLACGLRVEAKLDELIALLTEHQAPPPATRADRPPKGG